ncbi:UbiA prenyltransferase family protein [Marivirga sp. S37H4]|uniref:UbiA prenyltransferase family protein n=1 Tax=Marivirga aurantiaca TaxID=2802615 RepID=A0A934X2F0_9BACT|nr:UbiA family prenyltransferase [Marivirga aurantiaca]MBK6267135.1 UbiA prenyltransferase family protein [Marivirga aurantiaca]
MKSVINIIKHLRIPFSFFLLPVFLFALGISPNLVEDRIILVFVILHFLIYPASNAYNSYFDKDEGSIGLLKTPPPVTIGLYYTSLALDFIGIALAWLISMEFAVLVFVYGLASKAYSHPGIRLKKYPWLGWLVAGFFQGVFTFYMAYVGINDFSYQIAFSWKVIFPGLLTSLFLWGSYPMTQVYQHKEDSKRGDRTLSLVLGIKGTFLFTLVAFLLATLGFEYYFITFYSQKIAIAFLLFMLPTIVFFFVWFYLVNRNKTKANYGWTMGLNFLSAICLNAFFIYFFIQSSHLYQLDL